MPLRGSVVLVCFIMLPCGGKLDVLFCASIDTMLGPVFKSVVEGAVDDESPSSEAGGFLSKSEDIPDKNFEGPVANESRASLTECSNAGGGGTSPSPPSAVACVLFPPASFCTGKKCCNQSDTCGVN